MSACACDSPSVPNTATDLDGEMSIVRTVKRGPRESSPAKHLDASNEENSIEEGDSDSLNSQNVPERQIRRRIDVSQEMHENPQPELYELHEVHDSIQPSQNHASFSIDYSGTNDQELDPENIAAMESLRKSVLFYRTAKPSSEPYKLKFGDWTSFKALLQEAAEAFRSGSSEASRLREISLCSDSKSEELFNKEDVSCLIKKGVDIIHKEFFPDLPAVENEEYWNARKKRKINPAAEQASEIMDDYVPNLRMRSLIQSVESSIATIIELRNKEWFTVRDLRALFDSIINSNSSIIKFDAEVQIP